MTFKDLSLEEESESQLLQETAARQAVASTADLSTKIVSSAIKKTEGGQVRKFDELRTELLVSINEMHAESAKVAFDQFVNAIDQGFQTDLKGRATLQNEAEGDLTVEVDLTDEELKELEQYPVLGHTILELAMHLADNLRFAMTSVVNGPLRGEFDLSELPGRLDQEREKFARQVAQTLNSVYLSGTQASQELIRGGISASQNQG